MNADGNFPSYEQQQRVLTLLQELGVDVDTLIDQLGAVNTNASSIKTTVEDTNADLAVIDALVDDLITRLGLPTTAASSATGGNAHAKLNWLLTTLNNVYTNIGAPISTTSNATNAPAHAKLNYLLANPGSVKSIQRGVISIPENAESITATISPVTLSKSYLDFSYSADTAIEDMSHSTLTKGVLTNSTSITFSRTIKTTAKPGISIAWQLIEYY